VCSHGQVFDLPPAVEGSGSDGRSAELNQHSLRWRVRSRLVIALLLANAAGCADTLSHRDIRPPCEFPAPLEGKFDSRAPGFLIEIRPAADVVDVAHDLAIRYGFHISTVGAPSPFFVAGPMTPQTVGRAAMRLGLEIDQPRRIPGACWPVACRSKQPPGAALDRFPN
jgi:hypothetical protein